MAEVVNCFKISIFVLSNTTVAGMVHGESWLWIALKLVSLYYQTQHSWSFSIACLVVNCFKISIFVLSNTTCSGNRLASDALWIALKLVSLYYQTQRWYDRIYLLRVVNCFKISIFVLSNTTERFYQLSA